MPCLAGCSKSSSPSSGSGGTPAACTGAKCPDDPCGKDAISNVTKCCGSEIFDEAKKANGGKDPTIVIGPTSAGFGGETDTSTGTITVSDSLDKCQATQVALFELTNLAAKPKFDTIDSDASAGNLNREEYTKANARVEFEGLSKAAAVEDKCMDKWGCKGQPARHAWVRPAKDFDDFYDHYSTERYKNHYRNSWDSTYKTAYDAKHPAPPTH